MGLFDRKIRKNKEIEEEQNKEKKAKKEEFKESLKVKERQKKLKKKYGEQEYLKREERVKNYYLKQISHGFKDEGNMYEEFEGINISQGDNRGKILKIIDLELEKIDKDGSGAYLYSGFIGNFLEDGEVTEFDYWNMINNSRRLVPVCFEIYRDLGEIVRNGDKEEIKAVLEFLSDPKNFIDHKRLKYLGQLELKTEGNKFGEIVRKTVIHRRTYSNSPVIDAKIDMMQKAYAIKKENVEYKEEENLCK